MSQEKPDCVIDRADMLSEDGLSSSLQESLMQISLNLFIYFFPPLDNIPHFNAK